MSGIIVYRSSYGSTREYAQWIHEETKFPLFDPQDSTIPWNTDVVVIGCPIIANKPSLLGWMQKNWSKLRGKRVVLFTTSGADPAAAPVEDWIRESLPQEMKDHVQIFPLAGRFRFSELSGGHKAMLRIGAVVLRSEEIKNQIKNPVDGVSRDHLGALFETLGE